MTKNIYLQLNNLLNRFELCLCSINIIQSINYALYNLLNLSNVMALYCALFVLKIVNDRQ